MKKTEAEAECCEVTYVHDDTVRRIGTKMPEEGLLKELADFYERVKKREVFRRKL